MLTWLSDSKVCLFIFLCYPSLRILYKFGYFFHLHFKKKHNLESVQKNFHNYDQKVGIKWDGALYIEAKHNVKLKMAQMCTSRSKRKKYDGKGRAVGFMSMKNSSQGALVHLLKICLYLY